MTITLSVLDCVPVLDIDLLSFNGKLINSKAILSWSTSKENSPVSFIIEKSSDGRVFTATGEVQGYNNGNLVNQYSFAEPMSESDKIWYRIVLRTADGKKKYSSIIQLKNDLPQFELNNIINPFSNTLTFNIASPNNSIVIIELMDIAGKTVMYNKQIIFTGTTSINLSNMQSLTSGIYTLRVTNKNKFITKRVIKTN